MKKNNFKFILSLAAVLALGIMLLGNTKASAASASPVSVLGIDYENLEMNVYKNGNNIIYSSTDGKTWNELEGVVINNAGNHYLVTDISWASASSNVTLYLKGDVDQTNVKIIFPKQLTTFKAVFDKVNGTFTFTGYENQTYFFYRKSTDYNWIKVYFGDLEGQALTDAKAAIAANSDGHVISYETFLDNIEMLRFKGAKIVIKLGQDAGPTATQDNPGERPSKEISVSISKLASAPSIKLNTTKLTFNTKNTIEYRKETDLDWEICEKNMTLEDLAPEVLLDNGGTGPVNIYFRTQATEKKGASQICVVNIPVQIAAPNIGTDVTYSYVSGKLVIKFPIASTTKPFEYCIVKDDGSLETARWKAVTSNKSITLTQKAVEGAEIYVRYKGIAENVNKKISLQLPSQEASFTADGF